jgi:hypothetical protein
MDAYTRIAMLDNVVEARLLDAMLTERGIPHALVSFHDSAYDGIMQMQQGAWGAIDGPVAQRDLVLQLLADLRAEDSPPGAEPGDDAEATKP